MKFETRINLKTGQVTKVPVSRSADAPTSDELLRRRSGMSLSRVQLVKALGMAGILETRRDRIAFASGSIPPSLRTVVDAVSTNDAEDVEVMLLTGAQFPRLWAFWDAAISLGEVTPENLDRIYKRAKG